MGDLINGRTPEEIVEANRHCSRCFCDECAYFNAIERQTDLRRDCADLVKHLEVQQPKWISVKERLPEDGELVLVTMNGEIHGAKLFNRAYELACYYRDGEDEEGEYHIDGWELWDYGEGRVSDIEVFYWMPLPEPPEEETNETTD